MNEIERLGDGLRGSLHWFLSTVGLLALALLASAIIGVPPPREWAGWTEVGTVLAPAVLVALLLAAFGSLVVELTLAVSLIAVPAAVPAFTVTV